MTTDNAIAVLRRMQEPDPFEPQITQTAFDALEMAIDMIERYYTWSQTYSNMVEDAISRKAAVDVIHKYFAERIEQSPTHMTEDGEVYDLGICNPLLADNKALSQAIKELPSAQPEITRCKDCANWDTTWTNDWTPDYHYCPIIDGVRRGYFYCADAERRTDGSDR